MALAQDLAQKARSGTDFCKLVEQYSDDVSTRPACGSHGAQPMAALLPPIQEAVRKMKPGEVSDPIPIQLPTGDQAIAVIMPLGSARVPAYDDVKNDMMQRALLEGLDRGRKQWLQELRHNVYIDVRL
jgi:parvulin-like peptidyl-prolyl isomerase